MNRNGKVQVAVVGPGFGAEFIPIYQYHTDAELYAICQRNERSLNKIGDQFNVNRRFTRFDDLLSIKELDAIHINTPVGLHAEMSIAALNAGKHCACTESISTSSCATGYISQPTLLTRSKMSIRSPGSSHRCCK